MSRVGPVLQGLHTEYVYTVFQQQTHYIKQDKDGRHIDSQSDMIDMIFRFWVALFQPELVQESKDSAQQDNEWEDPLE